MKQLMTRHFSKWALKQNIPEKELANALAEVQSGNLKQTLGAAYTKKESVLKDRAKAAAAGRLSAVKKMTEPYSSTDLPKTKNRIYPKKN